MPRSKAGASRAGRCALSCRPQAMRNSNAAKIRSDMSALQLSVGRANADRCLSVLLRLQRLRRKAQAPGWRLLRVLLFRVGALSAGSGEWKERLLRLGEMMRYRSI